MTPEQMKNLSPGDIVRGLASGEPYMVQANCGDSVVVSSVKTITFPSDWELVFKAAHVREDGLEHFEVVRISGLSE